MTITTGKYEMRGGGIAEITEIGSFAYGKRPGAEDFWQFDGRHVPLRPAPQTSRASHSKYDLVRRIL